MKMLYSHHFMGSIKTKKLKRIKKSTEVMAQY